MDSSTKRAVRYQPLDWGGSWGITTGGYEGNVQGFCLATEAEAQAWADYLNNEGPRPDQDQGD